ncbi:MAG: CoA transferase [Rhizobiaceae bacterium]
MSARPRPHSGTADEEATAAPPLKGIRVVELTTVVTGPYAGMMLADLGADVVKVEQPDGGDPFRSFQGGHYGAYFCAYNRNKRSMTLDLRTEAGAAAIRELIATADVLLDNMRPGALDRLGLGDADISSLNPGLIHCSITGFGPDGPYGAKPAYDAVAQALSGMSSMFFDPGDPQVSGPTIADNVTAHNACQAVLAALLARERGQPARRIQINMVDATIAFMPDMFGVWYKDGLLPGVTSRARYSQSFAFTCSDDKMIALHLSSQDKFWNIFVDAIERPDLSADPRFCDRKLRIQNYEELRKALTPIFRSRSRPEWLDFFARIDVPIAPVYSMAEVAEDAHVKHLGTFVTVTHPQEGPLTTIRRPIWFDGSRDDQPMAPPPALGEHTEEILAELRLKK